MLSTILISVAVVLVIFAVANKYAKKTKQPITSNDDAKPKENPVVDPLKEGEEWNWKEVRYETNPLIEVVTKQKQPSIDVTVSETIVEKEPEVQPKPKAKKKMSAKPKTKAPKKKKDA